MARNVVKIPPRNTISHKGETHKGIVYIEGKPVEKDVVDGIRTNYGKDDNNNSVEMSTVTLDAEGGSNCFDENGQLVPDNAKDENGNAISNRGRRAIKLLVNIPDMEKADGSAGMEYNPNTGDFELPGDGEKTSAVCVTNVLNTNGAKTAQITEFDLAAIARENANAINAKNAISRPNAPKADPERITVQMAGLTVSHEGVSAIDPVAYKNRITEVAAYDTLLSKNKREPITETAIDIVAAVYTDTLTDTYTKIATNDFPGVKAAARDAKTGLVIPGKEGEYIEGTAIPSLSRYTDGDKGGVKVITDSKTGTVVIGANGVHDRTNNAIMTLTNDKGWSKECKANPRFERDIKNDKTGEYYNLNEIQTRNINRAVSCIMSQAFNSPDLPKMLQEKHPELAKALEDDKTGSLLKAVRNLGNNLDLQAHTVIPRDFQDKPLTGVTLIQPEMGAKMTPYASSLTQNIKAYRHELFVGTNGGLVPAGRDDDNRVVPPKGAALDAEGKPIEAGPVAVYGEDVLKAVNSIYDMAEKRENNPILRCVYAKAVCQKLGAFEASAQLSQSLTRAYPDVMNAIDKNNDLDKQAEALAKSFEVAGPEV